LFRILNGNEDDYFQEPFKMDSNCFIQLKLKSNREQLNREAIDIYNLNVSIASGGGSSRSDDYYFQIIIHIIDGNDNDPLFDKYEYQFDINDLTNLPPFSKIGQIASNDADMAKNSPVFYYISSYDPLFGLNKFLI
jgi:hypothetical protein